MPALVLHRVCFRCCSSIYKPHSTTHVAQTSNTTMLDAVTRLHLSATQKTLIIFFLGGCDANLCTLSTGSCRLPAAAQGLFSLRPTIGCYNFSDGLQPYQITRDTVGELAQPVVVQCLPVPDQVGSPECLDMVYVKKLLPGPVISCFATRSGSLPMYMYLLCCHLFLILTCRQPCQAPDRSILRHAGSMARTAGDLVLLDSIVRNSAAKTTGNGAVASALSCTVNVNSSMSLKGVRLGLPSTEGWVPSATYDGISGEVSPSWLSTILRTNNSMCKLTLREVFTDLPAADIDVKMRQCLIACCFTGHSALVCVTDTVCIPDCSCLQVESMHCCLSVCVIR